MPNTGFSHPAASKSSIAARMPRAAAAKPWAGPVRAAGRGSFWIFYSDYNVLALGDDYGWALVGGGSPKYLWILSRTPSLPQETLERILKLASDRGYDTDRLLFVDQTR